MASVAAHTTHTRTTSVCGVVIVLMGIVMLAAPLVSAQVVDQVDQENDVPWQGGAMNIAYYNAVGQSFVPSCSNLVAVEVALTTLNTGSGGDSVTAKILRAGASLTQAIQSVSEGFDDWLRFDFLSPVEVTLGETLILQLEDTGTIVFAWKYGGDTYPHGSRLFFGTAQDGDFLFRTYSTSCPILPPRPLCHGLPATVFVKDGFIVGGPDDGLRYTGYLRGTPGDDVIVGTDGPELIKGFAGHDTICGGGGDDRIEGGDGNDWIDGGPGDDLIKGQFGDDMLYGGDGDDRIEGGPGNDYLDGGPGHNILNGGTGMTDTCVNGPTFLVCEVFP